MANSRSECTFMELASFSEPGDAEQHKHHRSRFTDSSEVSRQKGHRESKTTPWDEGSIPFTRSKSKQSSTVRLLNLRHEFPTQWHRFLHPGSPANGKVFEFELIPILFPFRDHQKALKVISIGLLVHGKDGENYTAVLDPPLPSPPPTGSDTFELAQVNKFSRLHFGQKPVDVVVDLAAPPVKWQLKMTNPANAGGLLNNNPTQEMEDILLVLGYEWA
jgi:hypothetical protein